jgi:hypothetical protein
MDALEQIRHVTRGKGAPNDPWAAAAAVAATQHGAIARRQLRALGLTDRQIDLAMGRGHLHPVFRGAFAYGHPRLPPMGRWCAAALACGPDAALGYRTAAAAWALRPSTGAAIDIVVAGRVRRRHSGVTVRCHAGLSPDELTVLDGVRVTTVARTLLDLGAVVPPGSLRKAVAQAEIQGTFDLRDVERLGERHPRHRGKAALRAVLEAWTTPPRVRSILEERFVAVCETHGLPVPLMNSTVLGMEVDAVFPDHRVAVELDGARAHRGEVRREDDYARRARLVAAGWAFLAFTYRQTTADGGAFVAQTLRGTLAAREAGPTAVGSRNGRAAE